MYRLLSYHEHFSGKIESQLSFSDSDIYKYDFLKKRGQQNCFTITKDASDQHLQLSYFIGVDWIIEKDTALYVAPKLNIEGRQTDYQKMLFSALKHPEVTQYTDELFEIKFDSPCIEITQQQDLLTPLLIIHFLQLTKEIVKKGLKKSYYRVLRDITGSVKGKLMVSQTIKRNLVKNKSFNTYCSFDEFGTNTLENRLLKKALVFVQNYLQNSRSTDSIEYTFESLGYIMPAFEQIDGDVQLNEIKQSKTNVFYKEYSGAVNLAKIILKKFGYNISNTAPHTIISTPPFWIDMSKLFELYVLGLLKDRFQKVGIVQYQFGNRGSKLDYLLNTENYRMVVDAKYKTKYQDGVDHMDIRQVSGYARLKKVYQNLGVSEDKLIDCLIIYADQINGLRDLNVDLKQNTIDEYTGIYKIGLQLPILKTT